MIKEKMKKKILAVAALLIFAGGTAQGQYYDWGQDPASVKWRTLKTRDFRYIFPSTYEKNAVRIMHYLDTVRPQIGYGFTHGPLKRIPLIVHSQNFSPNGIMMLAPKRMELIVTPDAQAFAFPNLKELSVHEYRHAVQYNNLNKGMIRVLGWLLGQQGWLVGAGFMPMWAMEGDAVLTETQMSTFGRGLQPSFSIEYRAMAIEGAWDGYRTDKFFSGSYKDHMPDHYKLGYQMLAWADDHYGENVLDKTSRFSSRNPYMIFPFSIGLKKYYGRNTQTLMKDAFAAVSDYWRSLPQEDNTAQIVETPRTSYTTYTSPRALPDGRIVALKTDLDRPSHLVLVDGETGGEHVLCNTGPVNSPLSTDGTTVWWTEYRRSTFWEQRVHSQLCSYDLATGRKATHPEYRNVLFPVAAGDGLAMVEYDQSGVYTICRGEEKFAVPDTVSVHGLAYERRTDRLYFIGLSDSGMWIGVAGDGETGQITQPSYASLSNLTAGEGVLYFNSIASGKDEAHIYDLAARKEYRVTTSRYGSFSPSPLPSGDGVILTTYTPGGYLLARQSFDRDTLPEIPWAKVPPNVLNPERRRWPVMNMDEVKVDGNTSLPTKRYRKGLNLFNLHSWAPAYYEADNLMTGERFDIKAGITLMSQNNLNSAYTQLSYGWTGRHNVLHGKFNYSGRIPKFELDVRWSDMEQYVAQPPEGVGLTTRPADFFELTGRIYVPLLLSSGASQRMLAPSVEYQYENMKLYNHIDRSFKTGVHKVAFGLQFSRNRRMAHRDFLPRFGYAVRVNLTVDPFNYEFANLWSAFGRLYLPGLAPHHSITMRGAYQRSQDGFRYIYRLKELFPRGADWNAVAARRYFAAAVDYQLPVWYPDGGINSLLYFRRVRLNPGVDYARAENLWAPDRGRKWHNLWSYGADLIFDIVPLRLPENTSMTLTISVRKPSDRENLWGGFSLSLPI